MSEQDLIARLEAATEGSRELDWQIAEAAGWTQKDSWYSSDGVHWTLHLPSFSSSLDAALTLVPEGWAVDRISERDDDRGHKNWLASLWQKGVIAFADGNIVKSGPRHTAALALVIAALKARSAKP